MKNRVYDSLTKIKFLYENQFGFKHIQQNMQS